MNRFGEISPLWQQKVGLCQFLESLSSLWQNFEPNLVNFYVIGKIFIVINSQTFKNWFGHLVTLFEDIGCGQSR